MAWASVALFSVATTAAATWLSIGTTLARTGSTWLALGWAAALCGAVPLAIAWLRAGRDVARILLVLPGLSLLWNTGWVAALLVAAPGDVARALRMHGAWPFEHAHGATSPNAAVLATAAQWIADTIDDTGRLATTTPAGVGMSVGDAYVLPLRNDGRSITVAVQLEHGARQTSASYLFDTGASFLTMTTRAIEELGVAVPPAARSLTFATATGRREGRMLRLDALHIGPYVVRDVAVSVCDDCGGDGTAGLLGLSVLRRFEVRLDYIGGRLELLPREGASDGDRAYDVGALAEVSLDGNANILFSHVYWQVLVRNASDAWMRGVVPEVRWSTGDVLRGLPIDAVAPGETGRSIVVGSAPVTGTAADAAAPAFELGVARGRFEAKVSPKRP